MNEKVVALRPMPDGVAPGEAVNANVVEILERWLDRARRGEVDAVALAVSRPNGGVTSDMSTGSTAAMHRMIAAAVLLQADMGQMLLDLAR